MTADRLLSVIDYWLMAKLAFLCYLNLGLDWWTLVRKVDKHSRKTTNKKRI